MARRTSVPQLVRSYDDPKASLSFGQGRAAAELSDDANGNVNVKRLLPCRARRNHQPKPAKIESWSPRPGLPGKRL